jgi:hypothetical protein
MERHAGSRERAGVSGIEADIIALGPVGVSEPDDRTARIAVIADG